MCGIQIGRDQLQAVLAHSTAAGLTSQAACGLQVGHEELSAIIAHASTAGGAAAHAACGIQVGQPADDVTAEK